MTKDFKDPSYKYPFAGEPKGIGSVAPIFREKQKSDDYNFSLGYLWKTPLSVISGVLIIVATCKTNRHFNPCNVYELSKDKSGAVSIRVTEDKGFSSSEKTLFLDAKAIEDYNAIIKQAKKFDSLGLKDTVDIAVNTEKKNVHYAGVGIIQGLPSNSGRSSDPMAGKKIIPHSQRYLEQKLRRFAIDHAPDSAKTNPPCLGQ